jgi:exopolysaccharide biosynthesis polyprenyl glycosylphosphotransferase
MAYTTELQDAAVDRDRKAAAWRRPQRPSPPSAGRPGLKLVLIAFDALALLVGWLGSFALLGVRGAVVPMVALLFAVLGATIGFFMIAANGLWLARTCAIRSIEIRLLARASLISATAMIVLYEIADLEVSTRATLIGAAASFVLLVNTRSVFRWSLGRARRNGRFARPLLLVGWNNEAAELMSLLVEDRESGFHVVGVVSNERLPDTVGVPWVASYTDVDRAIHETGATGALVVASALRRDELNEITRRLLRARAHVHLSSGLRGVAHDRLRLYPVAYEPLIYVEGVEFSRVQAMIKRSVDLVGASVTAVAALPVLALAALAIKLDDGGPLLFKQHRVGKDGRCFTLYKLRTMVPAAEEQMVSLREFNGRAGPLFKMPCDPRVTRVGRVLRATSIDELPQLFNVMSGTMSLVGPRPALPREVETFDEQLRGRARVLPGITGLWQVEARDDPSFARYRRLDMFYVDNWSVGLDFSIIVATFGVVCGRALRFASRRWVSRRAAGRATAAREVLE